MQQSATNLNDLQFLALIALCLLASPYLAKLFRLPISVAELILGAVLAYFGLISESENLKLLANIGFYYLMFIAGMEVNLRDLFYIDKGIAKKAFLYISLLYILSTLIVWIFELSLIFILIMPVMSVGLLTILFKEFGKKAFWLNTSMLIATIAEVVSIIALTIMGAFLRENSSLILVAQNIFYLCVFLVLCLLGFKLLGILFWWYPQLKIILMPWEDKNERDIRFCVAIFILIIIAMFLTELEVVLGAFVAGSFIATFFNHKYDLEYKLSSFGYGFLIPIFFIYIGSTVDLRIVLEYKILLKALVLMFAMILIRFISAMVFVKKLGFLHTILFTLSHSMPLTLLIATATLSYSAKLIDENFYSALILTALFEALFVMSLIKLIAHFKNSV
ncbi:MULTISPECIES: cation:proton antiporter [unclassified Campylobacter]|uniref:cation:proton antiporter n=1 Tax=unclassified Campylobacter TaxID=2593542 RepID=UPI001237D014|nr:MULTISPECIES: cation:proton antiporter [unclassified Campylobacter]KAA6225135.1 cation:proton antiporter [Campylobacter sp. LR196d]KAA6226149.1 cation:proton antiporter [Campylobacter sp. LR185c]KAA6228097.1 cation:proton antiporter [Campylobacter sp. LR286c]KAA6231349.1 cation:proton antiporter [Campylobacter sp. LR264d]KAA6231561.1 cation:proton antiporter [Campylobacter sp. LR291e]